MTRLATRLRTADVPGEAEARERTWAIVSAAYEDRGRFAARRGRAGRLAAIAAAACVVIAAVAIALTPPGEAVGDWLRDVVRPVPQPTPAPHPSLGPLPGRGRLLVAGPTGPWIVQRDGSRRRLGSYDDATFSPHGLFVAATRGRVLAAVDPRGDVRWSLSASGLVTHPAWSPDGFRIAYRSGESLRVVYGDGARDRRLAGRSSAVTPAWLPGVGAHRVAFATGASVALRDADTGRELWRTRFAEPVRALAWAPRGRRLLVLGRDTATLLDARGGVLGHMEMPQGTLALAGAWLPSSRTFGVLRSRAGVSEVVLVRTHSRRLLAVPARLTGMLVSPDGRWLLLSAPDADQWLLVRTGAGGRIATRSDVARQFDPAARSPGRAPRPLGWIG